MIGFDITQLAHYREGNRLEVKAAKGGLPRSLWETYSAFGNTQGGLILLGVTECDDGSLEPVGLTAQQVERLRRDFWNTVCNASKVSCILPIERDVEAIEFDGSSILAISIPRAMREDRPVHINDDLYRGTFRRRGEGDYRCSRGEVVAMVRDQAIATMDAKIIDEFTLTDLNQDSIAAYRNVFKQVKQGSSWVNLEDDRFLRMIGAAGIGREDGRLHPTLAGLLMFGNEYDIVRECSDYFLDYRETLDPSTRWTDRVQSTDGRWSGNVFDFYTRVAPKLSMLVKTPFKLDGFQRVEDTPIHKAVREAFANCLFNADFYWRRGLVIKASYEKIVFENPGSIRTGVEQMRIGGVSDPRNAGIMKMFNLIEVGERAGSGIPDVYAAWKDAGYQEPVIEEQLGEVDRTILTLSFVPAAVTSAEDRRGSSADVTVNPSDVTVNPSDVTVNPSDVTVNPSDVTVNPSDVTVNPSEDKVTLPKTEKAVLRTLQLNSHITAREIADQLGLSERTIRRALRSLQEKGAIERIGSDKSGRWRVLS